MTTPIPSPPSLPFLGNLTVIEKEVPHRSFELLADQYGEIYKLNLVSELVLSNAAPLAFVVVAADRGFGLIDLPCSEGVDPGELV